MLAKPDPPPARKTSPVPEPVVPVSAVGLDAVRAVFAGYGLTVAPVAEGEPIPGSYWGEPEAGLVGAVLHVRPDTPVHSALHEGCHFLLMDAERRVGLHRDAGGSDTEEHAVCYLQCVMADRVAGYSRDRCFADMDAWGYTFILGSAAAWFASDSEDAQAWLRPFAGSLGLALP